MPVLSIETFSIAKKFFPLKYAVLVIVGVDSVFELYASNRRSVL